MIRQKMDEYLDGVLNEAERSALEARLANDSETAALLARMERERSARRAVYAAYVPSASEGTELAKRMLAACAEDAARPIGRIGGWIKSASAIAAAVALVVGGYIAGRMTTHSPVANTVVVARVLYSDDAGEPQMKEFASMDEADAFFKDMSSRHAEPVEVASGLDTEHPGSF